LQAPCVTFAEAPTAWHFYIFIHHGSNWLLA